MKILKPQKIDFFLAGGCLLGAIRQGSFAGRPSDIDFGIREKGVPTLLNAIPLFIKNGARFVRKQPHYKPERLQILFSNILVDIGVYRRKKVGKKEMWIAKTESYVRYGKTKNGKLCFNGFGNNNIRIFWK